MCLCCWGICSNGVCLIRWTFTRSLRVGIRQEFWWVHIGFDIPFPSTFLNIYSIGRSPSGWTDNEICQEWLEQKFMPFACSKCVDESKPIHQQILGALQVLQNTPGVLQSAWSALKCPPGFADVVLILDGHKSHENWELRHKIYAFSDCKVVVFCFPSKTTHKFQPLDVIVFSPVGHKWRLSSEQGIQLY